MNLKGKRARCLLWIGMLIVFAVTISLSAFTVAGECNPLGYTGGIGEWIIDPVDSECWYLHDIETEFDGGYNNCVACHDGVQAHDWYAE